MKHFLRITVFIALIVIAAIDGMAIEKPKYEVIKKDGNFEIRDYAGQIIAETVVEGSLEDAGSKGFKRLFRYISGENRSNGKVAMTAPVSQEPMGEKIKMTAPVTQKRLKESWVVSFMMPRSYTLETLPEPTDAKVALRKVPARRMAAVRYSGFWNEKGYLKHRAELESWINGMGLTIVGDPIWARYNPPFIPWFLRRNEVLIPVDTGTGKVKGHTNSEEGTQKNDP